MTTHKYDLPLSILILLIGLFPFPAAYGAPETDNRIFSMPVPEAEDVVTDWLRRLGYRLYRGDEAQGGVTLFGEKGGRQWQIQLMPHSPLATKVRARFIDGGVTESAELDKLWTRLSGDAQLPPNTIPPTPIVRSKRDAVVCIYSQISDPPLQISGFIIDAAGLIISTAHGLAYLEPVTVILNNGRNLPGRVIQIDKDLDLTLIDVQAPLTAAISLEQGRNMLRQGESLHIVGCPANLGITIFSGHISGPPRKADHHLLWQADITIHPGSSGSPVFDSEGNIVAVVKGRYRGTDSVGFLIPFESILKFIGSP